MEKNNELATKLDLPEDCALGSVTDDDRRLLRKIDWQILPIMFLTYFLQMIDKISINVSPAHQIAGRMEGLGSLLTATLLVCKRDGPADRLEHARQ